MTLPMAMVRPSSRSVNLPSWGTLANVSMHVTFSMRMRHVTMAPDLTKRTLVSFSFVLGSIFARILVTSHSSVAARGPRSMFVSETPDMVPVKPRRQARSREERGRRDGRPRPFKRATQVASKAAESTGPARGGLTGVDVEDARVAGRKDGLVLQEVHHHELRLELRCRGHCRGRGDGGCVTGSIWGDGRRIE